MASDFLRITLLLLISRLLLASAQVFHDRPGRLPESSRKTLHVAMGLLALTYPWIFRTTWPVVVLSAIYLLLLIASHHHEPLRRRVNPVFRSVERRSHGEYYFPLVTALLFALAAGDPVLYCTPLLLLTLCDAAAAVVGTHFGRHRYRVDNGFKSIEGSLAFFVCAVVVVGIGLATRHETGFLVACIVACVAFLATLVEAVCPRGLDNLLVPLTGFLTLQVAESVLIAAS